MFANTSMMNKGLVVLAVPLLLQWAWIGAAAADHWQIACAGAGASTLLAALLAWRVHHDLRRRLLAIADNAQRVACGQAPTPRLEGRDEITQVDSSFHAMAEALQRAGDEARRAGDEIRDLYHNAPCGHASLGSDGTFLAVNDAMLRWLGYGREEVIGKRKFTDLLDAQGQDVFRASFTRFQAAGSLNNLEFELHGNEGVRIPVLLSATASRDAQRKFGSARCSIVSILERKRADDALRKSEQRFRLLVDRVVDYAIIVLNAKGRIVSWNTGAERINGYKAQEIVGKHFSCFFPPDAIERNRPAHELQSAAQSGRFDDEGWRQRKDGSRYWANVVLTALYRDDGELEGFCEITSDLTERRLLEQELEERVVERTAALIEANRELENKSRENETFVYSVSHDLRSPLVNLEGFSRELALIGDDLRRQLQEDIVPASVRERSLALLNKDMAEAIRFIQSAVKRLSNIIDALLRLSRAGRVEYQWQTVVPGPMLTRIVEAMANTIAEHKASVIVNELPTLWGDPTALEQVFANLIGNAVNYLDPARPGEIEVGCASDHDGQLVFYVRDNGIGIPQELQTKVFQAFQRLHPEASPGEGLGLTLVRRIIERHRGRIWVESAVDRGSTFFVSLPGKPVLGERGT